jgi:acetolactate synthase-1/3 small subunit
MYMQMNERKKILTMLVENNYGVTSRVSGLFSRRGFNLDSFTGCDTLDPRYSRITVVVRGDQRSLEQIEKQVSKLEDVIDIKDLNEIDSVCRELVLVKIRVSPEQRQSIMAVANIFHG